MSKADRYNILFSGYTITDEIYNVTGTGTNVFGEDNRQRGVYESTLEVWTGAGKTGTQLTVNVDYEFKTLDSGYSADPDALESIYAGWALINTVTYNGVNLYFNYTTIGTYINKSDIATFAPSGIIQAYGGTSVPTGWVDCDGSAISRTVYDALFSAIGTTWGVGDGSTTFNVPDLRGAFLRGTGSHGSATMADGNPFAGAAVGSTENDQEQAFQVGAAADSTGARDYWGIAATRDARANATGGVSNETYSNFTTTSQGASNMLKAMDDGTYGTPRQGDETRPFNAGVKYIIKV
jgi:microcystin-dependent protein